MAREKNLTPMELYKAIIADRPEKLDGEEADYRRADVPAMRCGRCLHFFERRVDAFGVCELVRLEDDSPIKQNFVCDYYTDDGNNFPLMK